MRHLLLAAACVPLGSGMPGDSLKLVDHAGAEDDAARGDVLVRQTAHMTRMIDDLLDVLLAEAPELTRKVYILADCMSSVTVPDGQGGFVADFTPAAEAALQRFADAGMHLVRSTDPLAAWPGIA